MRVNLLLLLGILWLGTPDLLYGNKNPEGKLLDEAKAIKDADWQRVGFRWAVITTGPRKLRPSA